MEKGRVWHSVKSARLVFRVVKCECWELRALAQGHHHHQLFCIGCGFNTIFFLTICGDSSPEMTEIGTVLLRPFHYKIKQQEEELTETHGEYSVMWILFDSTLISIINGFNEFLRGLGTNRLLKTHYCDLKHQQLLLLFLGDCNSIVPNWNSFELSSIKIIPLTQLTYDYHLWHSSAIWGIFFVDKDAHCHSEANI